MLLQGNKSSWFILSLILLISCRNEQKELRELRKDMYEKSLSTIGTGEYILVYNQIVDSINIWKKNNLNLYRYFDNEVKYQVDSLLCFNTYRNKVILSILKQNVLENNTIDALWYFYGVKVKGEWLFFSGPSIVLLRERYQKNVHVPIPFDKMKELATKYVYSSYLIKNKEGDSEINDAFFNDLTSVAWGKSDTQAGWDSIYLEIIKRNWEEK